MDHFRHSAAKIFFASRTNQRLHCDISQQIYDDLVETLKSHSSQCKNATNDTEPTNGGIRGSYLADAGTIRAHALRFLANDDFTVADCMEQIKSFNCALIFLSHEVPLRTATTLRLATPPGLRNLGATCYLNSQLQCLAQNLGFLQGLFSWIPSGLDADNRMSKIISSMQSILLRMRYGPDSVIYTNDFATALNLENGEMQDPNEVRMQLRIALSSRYRHPLKQYIFLAIFKFARLLFDRMTESFRRSTMIVHGPEQSSIGDLLPSVFGGRIKYTTQCLECGLESTRSEDFMELLIPIAERTLVGLAMKSEKKSSNSASAMSDVDVQQCVNSYLHPESLEGENQYECSR